MPFSAVGLFILLLLVSATSRPLPFLHHYHQVVKLQAAPPSLFVRGSQNCHIQNAFGHFGHLPDIIYPISNCVQHRGFFLMKLGHIVLATTLCHFCCRVIRVVCGGDCNVPFLLHSALPRASRGCCKILCQFPPTDLPFPPMYRAHKTDSVKGTMTIVSPLSSMPAPLVASLLL
jgi:hypothetical protein